MVAFSRAVLPVGSIRLQFYTMCLCIYLPVFVDNLHGRKQMGNLRMALWDDWSIWQLFVVNFRCFVSRMSCWIFSGHEWASHTWTLLIYETTWTNTWISETRVRQTWVKCLIRTYTGHCHDQCGAHSGQYMAILCTCELRTVTVQIFQLMQHSYCFLLAYLTDTIVIQMVQDGCNWCMSYACMHVVCDDSVLIWTSTKASAF